jgi:phage FluMu gp28-like protein
MTSLFDIALPYQKRVITDPANVKVLNFARQIGKSWCCGFLSTYTCCKKPNSLVLYLSTGLRAANEALKTCLKFAEAVRVLSEGKITYTSNSTCITFSNGSRIMSLPGKPESCRGWSADLICLDEVAFWQNPDETWRAIVPTITNQLRGADKKVVICSTPMGRNSLFYDLCQRSKNETGWKYFQTTITDAQKEGLKVDIESLKKMMPDPYAWATEFECQFAESSNQLVSISDLVFVNPSTQKQYAEYFMGGDWARNSDGTSLVVFGREASGKICLVDLVNLHNVEYAKQIEVAK